MATMTNDISPPTITVSVFCIESIAHSNQLASFPVSPSFCAIIPRMTFCHMTSVMLRHPYVRYRRGRTVSMSLYLCIVGIGLRSETKKNFALTAVHLAYACEATTAKEPARSQVAVLDPWKSRLVRPHL